MVAHQIVAVALVVAQEYVLAMHAPVVLPPALCLLNGLSLGMVVVAERYVVLAQEVQYCLFSCHICAFFKTKIQTFACKTINPGLFLRQKFADATNFSTSMTLIG
jgi:hypothetical protein